MTQETAKANLKFITAFANGEQIQHRIIDEWVDNHEPMFYDGREYRIKPERVFALYNEKTKDIEYLSDNESNAINSITPYGWKKVELIKFNE